MPELILASTSPRRKEALCRLGIPFTSLPNNVDEQAAIKNITEDPERVALHLSRLKAEAVAKQHDSCFVLGMDTLVLVNDHIIGKPQNVDDATHILRMLSGRWHRVITGITLCNSSKGYLKQRAVCTRVKFRPLSDDDIKRYIAIGESLDKAGGYGIQSKGAMLVEEVQGDLTNVVGFPERTVIQMLQDTEIYQQAESNLEP